MKYLVLQAGSNNVVPYKQKLLIVNKENIMKAGIHIKRQIFG